MRHIIIGILSFGLLYVSGGVARSLGDADLDEDDLIVETTSGFVKGGYGGETPVGKKPVYWFRGIPFAEPPVGELRFQPPEPVKSWEGVKDVSEKTPECIQGGETTLSGSEDCLYLKIHTTELPKDQKKLPVMVWIYGGAFLGGQPNFTQHSPDSLLDQGVIVAAMHYRLGLFGFLSTEDNVVPGNNALKDQILALKWIKENIERFGGDPDNITIFGQSAGAASVGYLLQTPLTKGLFHRAILQSGSPLCLWSLAREPLSIARAVASELKVDSKDTQKLVNGLRSVDAGKLQIAHNTIMMNKILTTNLREGLFFGPVIEPEHEGAVLTGRSHQLLEEGQFHDVPIMIGYTSLEARLDEISAALRLLFFTYDLDSTKLIPIDMNVKGLIRRYLVGRKIKSEYFGNSMISTSNIEILEYISDDQFTRPIQETAILYSKKNPVYFYKFSYEGPLFGVTQRNFPGAGHTEDLGYIFNFGYEGSEEDYLTRSRMVKLWTNFAKSGNPTPTVDPLLQEIQWNPISEQELQYLEINKDLAVLEKPDYKSLSFWQNLYDNNGNPPYATY